MIVIDIETFWLLKLILQNPGSIWHQVAVMNQTKWLPNIPRTDRNVLVEKQVGVKFKQVKNYIITSDPSRYWAALTQ